MTSPRLVMIALPVIVLLLISSVSTALDMADVTVRPVDTRTLYLRLLEAFPEDDPGLAEDPFSPRGVRTRQPEVAAILATAEAARLTAEWPVGADRFRSAIRSLLDAPDADGDGLPGWGLPDPWDAFQDGSTNPPNQSYTISTAFGVHALLDALRLMRARRLNALDAGYSEREIGSLLRAICLRWSVEAYTSDGAGGFYWYSPKVVDAKDVPNVSAYFAGACHRALVELSDWADASERDWLRSRLDGAVRRVADRGRIGPRGPRWDYSTTTSGPNDLAHHSYIVLGLETYRATGGTISLAWSRLDAGNVSAWWKSGVVREYEADAGADDRPARLWAAGMFLFVTSCWEPGLAADALTSIRLNYGSWPRLREYPATFTSDANVYGRHLVHLLWGLSAMLFREAACDTVR